LELIPALDVSMDAGSFGSSDKGIFLPMVSAQIRADSLSGLV
jgi:hypothetical protein